MYNISNEMNLLLLLLLEYPPFHSRNGFYISDYYEGRWRFCVCVCVWAGKVLSQNYFMFDCLILEFLIDIFFVFIHNRFVRNFNFFFWRIVYLYIDCLNALK